MTLTNQALSSAADKDLELSKQVCREAVNEVIEKNHLTLSPQFTQNLVVHLAIAILRIKTNNYIPLSQGQITSYKANTNYDSAVEICNILSKKFNIHLLTLLHPIQRRWMINYLKKTCLRQQNLKPII